MPLDARIPLQAIGIQAPDVLGAMAQGQQYRQNQMAMQASEAAAARNAMIQQRAAATDFTSPDAVNAFVREAGPDATPYLEAAAAGAGLGTARSAETRAQGEYARKIRGEDQGFMQRALAAVYNDPSDASIAAARAGAIAAGIGEADFDAYAARFMATPDLAARRALLANELGTTEQGRALLERFTREIAMDDVGGSLVPRDTNLLAPGAVMPTARAKTPDPTDFEDISTPDGIVRVYPDGRSELLRGPTGAPLTPAPTPSEERRQERLDDRAAAADRAAEDALSKANTALDTIDLAMDSTNWTTAGVAGALDWVPGSPPKRLAGYLNTIRANVAFNELQQMRRNSPTGGALGNVSDADMRLLQSTLATLDQQASPEDLRRALATIKRVTEAVRDAYAADIRNSAAGGGGGAAMPPVGARGATLTNSQTGATFVSDGTRWVPR